MNYLAIDYGTRKSGLAYSVGFFAFGKKTVRTNELIETLEDLIAEKKVSGIVLGMPYNIDGTMSLHGQRVQSFAKILEKRFCLPIYCQDERLTSSEAHIVFTEAGIDGDIDTESARLILDRFLLKFLK